LLKKYGGDKVIKWLHSGDKKKVVFGINKFHLTKSFYRDVLYPPSCKKKKSRLVFKDRYFYFIF
jgi:hypothetical protein